MIYKKIFPKIQMEIHLSAVLGTVIKCPNTPPNSEIICVQNVGTKVVCGIIFFKEKKIMLKI
jgi:hypothetical protein